MWQAGLVGFSKWSVQLDDGFPARPGCSKIHKMVVLYSCVFICKREKFTVGPSTWLKVFQSDICGSLNLTKSVIQVSKLKVISAGP
jgi:hypothetical protein